MYKPIYRITPYLLNLIEEVSNLKTWVENASVSVPWLPLLQKEAREKNTHSSTSIEGNPLSLKEIEAVSLGKRTGHIQSYEKEVQNYLMAIRFISRQQNSKIEEKTILKLHAILTSELLPKSKSGKYKDTQNYVVNEKGIRIYTPPSPKETPPLMKSLIAWLNLEETKILHSILVCAIFHHRLVSIHPFADGNGRIARVIGTWILYQRGFDTNHIFSLDDFFASDKKRYYMKIEQARELDNDLTYWIEYVTEGVIKTLKDVKNRIEELQVSTKTKIRLSARQEELFR